MKTDFQFSGLLGTVYRTGNLVYTSDGTCLLSPVGNRVTVFDLVHNTSHTLPFAHRTNIARLALHPRGQLLLSVDSQGHVILSHFRRRVVLYHFSLKGLVHALVFSPCGEYFAVAIGRRIEVWKTPAAPGAAAEDDGGTLDFAPFVRHRRYVGHHDVVQSIEWSSDSRFFLSASKDLTARIWSLNPEDGFTPTTLAGHRTAVNAAWFSADQETIFTISSDGALFQWQYLPSPEADLDNIDPDDERWRIRERNYFYQSQDHAHLTTAAFHPRSNILVTGFSNGLFMLHELPSFSEIHKLSISARSNIDTVSISPGGEWLAFGSSALGQLLVWEWQSESYILKQQGHFDSLNALAYSPSGDRIITCADDGKVKVWDTTSGFCIVTFTEHTSGVTACEFAKRGNVLFTASLDGSVRAFDLIRYRCFRTFTAPRRLSFSSIAVDPSGEVVAAGSLDDFDVHIWSVQTGQLLDQLSGHEGPVSSLAFSSSGGNLVSGSWDRTVRIWSVFARTQTSEPLQLQADVLCVSIRPDAKQIAVATLDGQLTFWSLSEGTQESGLDGRRDVSGGRKITDRRTAANVAGTKSFQTLAYSADGSVVLAAGNSKHICLYAVETGVLLHKYTVSVNLSLDGTQDFLNSRLLTEAGPRGVQDDEQGEASDLEDRLGQSLPGSKRGDAGARDKNAPREIRVPSLAFSPTGRAFCAATTEGLLIYSLDATTSVQFDPFDLDIDITPQNTTATLRDREWLKALLMAFRLDSTSSSLISHVYRSIPSTDISLVARAVPEIYLPRLLRLVATETEHSPHLERNLLWLSSLLRLHAHVLRGNRGGEYVEVVRLVRRAVARMQSEIMNVADRNAHLLDYLLAQSRTREAGAKGRGGDGAEVVSLNGKWNGNGNGVGRELGVDAEDDDTNMPDDEEWHGLE